MGTLLKQAGQLCLRSRTSSMLCPRSLIITRLFHKGSYLVYSPGVLLQRPLPPKILRRFKQTFDINTNVPKDVILFKYENPKFFKILNAFSLCQFLFWAYLSHFAFTTLKDAPVSKADEDLPWWRRINLGENKYRNGITIFSFAIGYMILCASWMYTLKSVRFLVLRKGGQSVTFVSYGPFGKNRMMTVPLVNVCCKEARHNARVQLPIKVQGHWLHYLLDMRGEFTNPQLFDHTAGLRRNFPKYST